MDSQAPAVNSDAWRSSHFAPQGIGYLHRSHTYVTQRQKRDRGTAAAAATATATETETEKEAEAETETQPAETDKRQRQRQRHRHRHSRQRQRAIHIDWSRYSLRGRSSAPALTVGIDFLDRWIDK